MNEPKNLPAHERTYGPLPDGERVFHQRMQMISGTLADARTTIDYWRWRAEKAETELAREQGRLAQLERRVTDFYELARKHWSMPVGEALTEFGKMR